MGGPNTAPGGFFLGENRSDNLPIINADAYKCLGAQWCTSCCLHSLLHPHFRVEHVFCTKHRATLVGIAPSLEPSQSLTWPTSMPTQIGKVHNQAHTIQPSNPHPSQPFKGEGVEMHKSNSSERVWLPMSPLFYSTGKLHYTSCNFPSTSASFNLNQSSPRLAQAAGRK